ncbi:glycosyltransferase family 4 protein [Verrucomicrobiales bacterium]|nr:glycosyltransferase family 4 protein [Verrucomicrobiales bacterium]
MNKILYLYSELMDYSIGTIEVLKEKNEILVIHWDKNKKSKYEKDQLDNVKFLPRSKFKSIRSIFEAINNFNPDLLVISGWMDLPYLIAAYRYKRNNNIIIVAGIDDQWNGSVRQYLGSIFIRLFRPFDAFWVTGSRQYEYAKRFGGNNNNIVSDFYSARTSKWKPIKAQARREFIYVGRLDRVKNISMLIETFIKFTEISKFSWGLTIIGDGSEKDNLDFRHEKISYLGFLQPDDLINNIQKGGVFVLPSNKEAWGVVVHEMATVSMPLLLSDVVGAESPFLIHKYNGYRFKNKSVNSLLDGFNYFDALTDEQLITHGENSYELSKRINSHTSAANLESLIE